MGIDTNLKAEVALIAYVFVVVGIVFLIYGFSSKAVFGQWWFWLVMIAPAGAIYFALSEWHLFSSKSKTQLQEGEYVVAHFVGGIGSAEEKPKGLFAPQERLGKWIITKARLMYEGETESFDPKKDNSNAWLDEI